MELTFLGAAQEVTGSSYLLESDNAKLLIDFGMFQGKEEDWNYQPLDIKAKEVNALLLTHAHLDHSGRIPVLVKNGFRGPIFATPPTIELTKLLWEDTVKLMKEEKERLDRKRRRQDKPPVELLFDKAAGNHNLDILASPEGLKCLLPNNSTKMIMKLNNIF